MAVDLAARMLASSADIRHRRRRRHPPRRHASRAAHGAHRAPARTTPTPTASSCARRAIATSGLRTRTWKTPDGYAHHLIDPASGEPAWTGVIQATALAATALEAETLAKTALLRGPHAGRTLLARHGGALILDDGELLAGRQPRHQHSSRGDRRMTTADPTQQVFWLASRALGIVAIALLAISVGLGLAMSGRLARRPGLPAKLKRFHEASSLVTLGLIVAHAGVLLADGYLRPGLTGITLPFQLSLPAALDRHRDHRRVARADPGAELLRTHADRREDLALAAPLDSRGVRARPRPRHRRRNRRPLDVDDRDAHAADGADRLRLHLPHAPPAPRPRAATAGNAATPRRPPTAAHTTASSPGA